MKEQEDIKIHPKGAWLLVVATLVIGALCCIMASRPHDTHVAAYDDTNRGRIMEQGEGGTSNGHDSYTVPEKAREAQAGSMR